jgi:hypothetical protein
MKTIHARWTRGAIVPSESVNWPEGCELRVIPVDKIGLDESEWRDDEAAIAEWEQWLQTIEPLEYTPDEVEKMTEFDEAMRKFNLEAVRQQMLKDE